MVIPRRDERLAHSHYPRLTTSGSERDVGELTGRASPPRKVDLLLPEESFVEVAPLGLLEVGILPELAHHHGQGCAVQLGERHQVVKREFLLPLLDLHDVAAMESETRRSLTRGESCTLPSLAQLDAEHAPEMVRVHGSRRAEACVPFFCPQV